MISPGNTGVKQIVGYFCFALLKSLGNFCFSTPRKTVTEAETPKQGEAGLKQAEASLKQA
jgi:hypothetical protein